jgi:hypothetical protein
MFVDPRAEPQPPFGGRRPEPTADANDLAGLVRLCRRGRIYEIERWIQAGKPIHADEYKKHGKPRVHSPLEIAIETNQFDLAVLLLCNGFPPDSGEDSLLVRALDERKTEFFELLIAWEADPLRVDVDTVLSTYDGETYERFWQVGVDFTRDHALAHALSDNSSNRPGYRWAKRHKDDPRVAREMAIALGQAVTENRERAVALLMWAGADPHQRVPDLRWWRSDIDEEENDQSSPMATAVLYGHGHLLPLLKPDPSRDDFEELWSWACDPFAIDLLAKNQPPEDWSRTLIRNIRQIVADYGNHSRAMECVEKLTVSYDARLMSMEPDEIAWLRRDILKCRDDHRCRWTLRWMSYAETCEPAVYAELTRTASMRAKVESLHVRDARYR